MPHNRFTISQRLSEEAFAGLVYDFVLGVHYAASAKRVGVSEKTAKRNYELIRARFIDVFMNIDERIKEVWPSRDSPIWISVYNCMFECPNSTEDDYEYSKRDNEFYWSPNQRKQNVRIPRHRNLGKCTQCNLYEPFKLPERLGFAIRMKIQNQRGFDVSKFGELFIEEVFRDFLLVPRTEDLTTNQIVFEILQSAMANKL